MKKVIVVGGGVAGMQAAITLSELGMKPLIIEKQDRLGGKLNNWYKLFPSLTPAQKVVAELVSKLKALDVEVRFGLGVVKVEQTSVETHTGEKIACDAVIVCNGFKLFDARIKEEYGYGLYDNVCTSTDLEQMFKTDTLKKEFGENPERIALLHCVGSRDAKVGQHHCSKVCCITGVKQAIELKEIYPKCEIFNFYMDIRMFGPGYEKFYKDAQVKHNIHFVRGRISESSPTIDNKIQIKAEDTLVGRPLRMSVDKLILLVGMCAEPENRSYAENPDIDLMYTGFIEPKDLFLGGCQSQKGNIFYAGTTTSPKTVGESMHEGVVAAYDVAKFLEQ